MKICIVTKKDAGFTHNTPVCDIALFPFGTLGMVDYAGELAGKSDKLERLAKFSGKAKCGVLCGCVTDSRGIVRKSVAAAGGGRLIGIADMLHVLDGEGFRCGASLGVYTLNGFKVGVCIEQDLCFPECMQAFAVCGCNLVCVHTEGLQNGMYPLLVRAYAYLYGMPVALSAGGSAYFADITGVIAFSNQPYAVFETSAKNCYRQVFVKRRGLISCSDDDY